MVAILQVPRVTSVSGVSVTVTAAARKEVIKESMGVSTCRRTTKSLAAQRHAACSQVASDMRSIERNTIAIIVSKHPANRNSFEILVDSTVF